MTDSPRDLEASGRLELPTFRNKTPALVRTSMTEVCSLSLHSPGQEEVNGGLLLLLSGEPANGKSLLLGFCQRFLQIAFISDNVIFTALSSPAVKQKTSWDLLLETPVLSINAARWQEPRTCGRSSRGILVKGLSISLRFL